MQRKPIFRIVLCASWNYSWTCSHAWFTSPINFTSYSTSGIWISSKDFPSQGNLLLLLAASTISCITYLAQNVLSVYIPIKFHLFQCFCILNFLKIFSPNNFTAHQLSERLSPLAWAQNLQAPGYHTQRSFVFLVSDIHSIVSNILCSV